MEKDVRIVFMGTPEFAIPSLEILLENKYNVVGVVTAPDKPAGRGKLIKSPPVKEFALANNVKVLQPKNLKDPQFNQELMDLRPDIQVVVAFRMLPEIVWKRPTMGTFNLHASLLPNYRGAAPINWAIINGETETGITTFFINEKIDTGDILLQERISIDRKQSAGDLHDELMVKGSRLVLQTVQGIAKGSLQPMAQTNQEGVLPAPKIFKKDCQINWEQDANSIHNKIRGLSPYPGAWTVVNLPNGKKYQLKIFAASHEESAPTISPGKVITDNKSYVKIGCSNGCISLNEVQAEGRKRNTISEFIMGAKDIQDWIIG